MWNLCLFWWQHFPLSRGLSIDKIHSESSLPLTIFLSPPRFWGARDQTQPGSLFSRSGGRGERTGKEVANILIISALFLCFVSISVKVFPDNFMRREVQAFVVHCTFVDDGCKWKGEVRHLEVNGLNVTVTVKMIKQFPQQKDYFFHELRWFYRAANNSRSSDIGRPKFAHVWRKTHSSVVGHNVRSIFWSWIILRQRWMKICPTTILFCPTKMVS